MALSPTSFGRQDLGLLALLGGLGTLAANRPGVGAGPAVGQGLLSGLGLLNQFQGQGLQRQLQQAQLTAAQAKNKQLQNQAAILARLFPSGVPQPGGVPGGQLPPAPGLPGGVLSAGGQPGGGQGGPGGPVFAGPPLPTPLMVGGPQQLPAQPTAPQQTGAAQPAGVGIPQTGGLASRFTNPNLPLQLGAAGMAPLGQMIAAQQQRQATAAANTVKQTAAATKQTFEFENKLRKQFLDESGPFIGIRDAFSRVQSATADPSAAGDLALIFNYMKILDPGSTVREGEFATAEESAGVPARIRNLYNKVITGERLGDEQRTDFVNQAGNLFKSQKRQQDKLAKQFTGLSERNKLNPLNVVIDVTGEFLPQPDAAEPQQAPAPGVQTQTAGPQGATEAPAIGSRVPVGEVGKLQEGIQGVIVEDDGTRTPAVVRGGRLVPLDEDETPNVRLQERRQRLGR